MYILGGCLEPSKPSNAHFHLPFYRILLPTTDAKEKLTFYLCYVHLEFIIYTMIYYETNQRIERTELGVGVVISYNILSM